MKKTTIIIMVLCLVFGLFTVTSSAASSSGGKYVKLKKAVYLKYKKAYTENAALKKKIKSLESQNKALKKQVSNDKSAKLKEELDSANSMNSWVWCNLKSMGITYNGKIWTIPAEFPSTYIIDGATYTVKMQE